MQKMFDTIPQRAHKTPQHFTLSFPSEDRSDFQALLKLSKIGPETFYNQHTTDRQFGISREWLIKAKDTWLQSDPHALESRVNSFPNFKSDVQTPAGDKTAEIHFVALFSNKTDATPVSFMHGWPGSFLEFMPMLDRLVDKYTPDTLPYHVIVPSLPGYGLSGDISPQDTETTLEDAAAILHQLMIDLGFGTGYVAQGGDVGSFLARIMSRYEECKAVHSKVNIITPNPHDGPLPTAEAYTGPGELAHLERSKKWVQTGQAYNNEHATRPATIGLVLSASPLALLAWVGEKYLEWADPRQPLTVECILECAELYWFTSTFPRSIYPYRDLLMRQAAGPQGVASISPDVQLGYSYFPREISFLPKSWAEQKYSNLVFYKAHEFGGHFAALEQPDAFLQDVEEFLQVVSSKK